MIEDGKNVLGCDVIGENCIILIMLFFIDSVGINQFGGDVEGKGWFKFCNGFNSKGCSLEGVDVWGEFCVVEDIFCFIDEDGVDQFGINVFIGFNCFGCDIYG